MKNRLFHYLLISLVTIQFSFAQVNIPNAIDLQFKWKFALGDTLNWKEQDYDDSMWKEIQIGKNWDEQGYANYDGFAWYRIRLKLPELNVNTRVIINLGNIDDADEVYFKRVFHIV